MELSWILEDNESINSSSRDGIQEFALSIREELSSNNISEESVATQEPLYNTRAVSPSIQEFPQFGSVVIHARSNLFHSQESLYNTRAVSPSNTLEWPGETGIVSSTNFLRIEPVIPLSITVGSEVINIKDVEACVKCGSTGGVCLGELQVCIKCAFNLLASILPANPVAKELSKIFEVKSNKRLLRKGE